MNRAVIIGGGASGLFCAVCLGRLGVSCLVLERNRSVGRKLAITGKGRCNVTNNCSSQEVMKNIPRNPRFMFSSLDRLSPADVMAFFEQLGVPLITERGGRVFPASGRASDVVSALEHEAKRLGAEIRHERAASLLIENAMAVGVKTEKDVYKAGAVVVATGGVSYPATGSTGDGYSFARAAGHTIETVFPSLVPVETKESEPSEMMGLSLKNVRLSLVDLSGGMTVYSEMGELLFTHFGLSGPLVLSASAHICEGADYALDIDLKPALSFEQLDARVLRDFADEKNRDFANSLGRLLPSAMIPVIIRRSMIPPQTKVNSVTREQRRGLVELLKRYRLHVRRLRPVEEAIITRGGVSTKELNPSTMQSKLCEGLYFIGEVIDVDGYTGGFNLQIAFSTANAAAEAISRRMISDK